jgi:hypothetical protein
MKLLLGIFIFTILSASPQAKAASFFPDYARQELEKTELIRKEQIRKIIFEFDENLPLSFDTLDSESVFRVRRPTADILVVGYRIKDEELESNQVFYFKKLFFEIALILNSKNNFQVSMGFLKNCQIVERPDQQKFCVDNFWSEYGKYTADYEFQIIKGIYERQHQSDRMEIKGYELINSLFPAHLYLFEFDSQYACEYPAMTLYFNRVFGANKPLCDLALQVIEGKTKDIFNISPQELESINYIFVSEGTGVSRFGHAMFGFEFSRPQGAFPSSASLVFTAFKNAETLTAQLFSINSLVAQISYLVGEQKFYFGEDRSLKFFRLNLNSKQRLRFILLANEIRRRGLGDWSHLSNNCTVSSAQILQFALVGQVDEKSLKNLSVIAPAQLAQAIVNLRTKKNESVFSGVKTLESISKKASSL